jgi:hydrophobe/amphiphile efflux-3 (HAE3) family protein
VRPFNLAVTRHPWATIVLFVLVTIGLGSAVPRLDLNSDAEAIIPSDHPEMIYKAWVEDYFGVDSPAVLLITADGEDGVFTPENLALIKHLSDALKAMDQIDGDDLVSLSEVDNILGADDSLLVEPFFEQPPATLEQARAVRRAVLANPMMTGTVVSADGAATVVLAEHLPDTDKQKLYVDLQELVAKAPRTGAEVLIAGRPMVEGELGRMAKEDIAIMFPVVVLMAAMVLWFSLRCIRGVLLPLVVVVSSVVWTTGLMAWTGATFYALSNSMVIILIPIGIADGIHVIDRFLYRAEQMPGPSQEVTVFETMQDMFLPVVLTSITTAFGMASLAASEVGSIRSLGVFTALGVLAAMVFSLTVLPALLVVLPEPRISSRGDRAGNHHGPALRFLATLDRFVTRRSTAAIALGAAILVFGLLGIPSLVTDASMIQNFPHDHPVRLADRAQFRHFTGTLPTEIVIDAHEVDAWKDPELLRALDRYQSALEGSELYGEGRSIADYIRRMNAVMNPDDPGADRIPDDRDLIAQYLLLYSISGEPDDLDDVVDYDYRFANLRISARSDHSPDLMAAVRLALDEAGAILEPTGVDVHPSGTARSSETFMSLIILGQARSLLLALILVLVINALVFRSVSAGFLMLMPVGIATVLNFGMLGWIGVPLGVTTALMSSIAIGIGVDYAIHFVAAYRRERSSGVNADVAMTTTLSTAGRGILYNAMVVVAGFMVLLLSGFVPNQALGGLVTLSVFTCLVITVTSLAALLHRTQPRFVLGDPERTGRSGVADRKTA